MIEFSWELEDEVHIFNSYKELIEELRNGNVDPNNELSDEFLINESYQLGEWEYEGKMEPLLYSDLNKLT
tara:strand:- start:19 stop:228 length:210 start_codon:yes stop_codon:yes gene_type:complete